MKRMKDGPNVGGGVYDGGDREGKMEILVEICILRERLV